MAESTIDPSTYSISVKDSTGNDTGVYLFLDNVPENGEARILEFFDITSENRTNEDNSVTQMFVYQQRIIPWNLPQYYTLNGVKTEIGRNEVELINGKDVYTRIITREEAEAYITANAPEISSFAMQTKIKFVG